MKQRKKNKYVSLVFPIVEAVVKKLGLCLVDITFTNENQTNYLRLTVMHEDRSVSISDCAIISKNVGKELDSSDPIPFSYILEVQSRGVVTEPVQSQEHEFVLEKTGLTVRS